MYTERRKGCSIISIYTFPTKGHSTSTSRIRLYARTMQCMINILGSDYYWIGSSTCTCVGPTELLYSGKLHELEANENFVEKTFVNCSVPSIMQAMSPQFALMPPKPFLLRKFPAIRYVSMHTIGSILSCVCNSQGQSHHQLCLNDQCLYTVSQPLPYALPHEWSSVDSTVQQAG